MASYRKSEAREWAREHLRGVANVVIPSYTTDLEGLNEAGIRHDIRKVIEFGFRGTLLVSEVAITLDEYRQFFAWSNDEAKGRLTLIHQAMFNTLKQNIAAAKIAEANGAELVLLCYPVSFYAESSQDIYDYTKAFCDGTNLAVMLFQVPHWGFQRVHGADLEPALIRRLIDDCPNVAAIKAEGGMPSTMGFVECHRLFGEEVVISCPLEKDMIPFAQLVPTQFSGTSNTEYFGNTIPRIFDLVQKGEFDEASTALLADPAGAARQPGDLGLHGADQRAQPHAVEVPGLAQRLQWRPDAPALHARHRRLDGDAAPGPRQIRHQADRSARPRVLRRAASGGERRRGASARSMRG